VIVHFVDIGGIVDHYCLNFLFIMSQNIMVKYTAEHQEMRWK
jgi:hypothetical protein